ncbi:MAG: DUF4347 domain-containing protein, partial [Verrucomicrobiae bacterium]|nr:DUF4347 domain-containing protein [Verrucomicrobiae bacterium]
MEPRVLYSAVPTDPIEGPADDSAIQVQDVAPAEFVTEDGDIAPSEGVTESEAPIPADHSLTPQDDATDRATEDSLIQQINTSTENTALTGRHEIVFISTDVYDYEYLASHLNPNLELVFIDATQDGMEQMATALEGRTGIDAIHLLTHGSAGELQVGNAILDATSMSGEYADELAAIGAALSEDGDFLIYGCNFAAGETGAAAAGLIASLTGADVAASTDNTGGDLQGGNWILENKIGSIEAETITDSSWRGILVPGDNDNDGISDFYDIDDDNDGITDDEESGTVQVNLNVVTSIPAGAIPGNPAGMRLSDASGNYVVDIYLGSNSSAGAPFTFNTTTGRIESTSANVSKTEVVHIVYSTVNSPVPFSLHRIQILDLDSLTAGAGPTNVRDAWAFSEAGTWTPQGTGGAGSPAGAVVSVNLAAADDVGSFVINDPDGNNVISNIGQFTQMTAVDSSVSDVLLNMAGVNDNHDAVFEFVGYHQTVSLYGINSGASNMSWGFFPQMTVTVPPAIKPDSDGDGIPDQFDIDSDNDGITDNVEAQSTAGYIAPLGSDVDGNGLDDAYESSPGAGGGLIPVDTDSDGTADYLDADSDNDSYGDITERGDGQPTSVTSLTDTDGDGLLDIFEGSNANDGFDANDENLSGSNFNLSGSPTLNPDGSNAVPLSVDLSFRKPNEAPLADDSSISVDEESIDTPLGLTAPTDGDGDTLTITVTGLPSVGTVTLANGTPVTNGMTLTSAQLTGLLYDAPAELASAVNTSFTYTVSDGKAPADTGTVAIAVSPVNDPPVNTVPGTPYSVSEPSSVALTGVSVADVDDTNLTVEVSVSSGILTLGTTTGLSFTGSNGTASFTISGTKADINNALATLSYQPNAGFSGTDTFEITTTDPGTLSDTDSVNIVVSPDNRPLSVTGTTVNEASPYVFFEVAGAVGQQTTLTLSSTGVGAGHATLGSDALSSLEYFDGTTWQAYTGTPVSIPAGGTLLVRSAVQQDTLDEGAETLQLTATNNAGTHNSANSTITDDGTGSIFTGGNTTGTPNNPGDPGYPAYLDDDRAISVSSITVNEGSPWGVFTVTGNVGQILQIDLSDGTATGADYGPALEIFDGSNWVSYTPGSDITLTSATLLVRTAITQDTISEGSETFTLDVTRASSGTTASGTATITDDGTGSIFTGGNTTGTPNNPGDPGYP